jgi:hypothetical protein
LCRPPITLRNRKNDSSRTNQRSPEKAWRQNAGILKLVANSYGLGDVASLDASHLQRLNEEIDDIIDQHEETLTDLITYIRVSTSQQGRSGLGIEARRHTLANFAQAEGLTVTREFVEVETGKGSDALDRRPQLKAALAAARKLRCHVAVAKLDRLSRDVHFISGLMAHKV